MYKDVNDDYLISYFHLDGGKSERNCGDQATWSG